MAASNDESLTFLCDKVMLDGQRLYPLDPTVKFVLFRVNMIAQELQFVYKETLDPLAEERQSIIKWDHIACSSSSRERSVNLVTLKFKRYLCGYSVCHLNVSSLIFDRLVDIIDHIYFTVMNAQFGMSEEQARENIQELYVFEDEGFGCEEDAENENTPRVEGIITMEELDNSTDTVGTNSSGTTNDEQIVPQNSEENSESISQLPVDEKIEEVEPVNEEVSIVQQATDEKAEEIEPVKENDSIVQLAIEEKAEKESPASVEENNVEEK